MYVTSSESIPVYGTWDSWWGSVWERGMCVWRRFVRVCMSRLSSTLRLAWENHLSLYSLFFTPVLLEFSASVSSSLGRQFPPWIPPHPCFMVSSTAPLSVPSPWPPAVSTNKVGVTLQLRRAGFNDWETISEPMKCLPEDCSWINGNPVGHPWTD